MQDVQAGAPEPAKSGSILTTRSGFHFWVRPARAEDEAALGEFFTHVTQEDLRFRFLSAVPRVDHDLLAFLTDVDHDRTENFLAFEADASTVIATAMLAAAPGLGRAEVALSVRADYKRRGISWTLLEHVARAARAKGIRKLESIESRNHHEAIELEREMGFTAAGYPGDSTLVLLEADLGARTG